MISKQYVVLFSLYYSTILNYIKSSPTYIRYIKEVKVAIITNKFGKDFHLRTTGLGGAVASMLVLHREGLQLNSISKMPISLNIER